MKTPNQLLEDIIVASPSRPDLWISTLRSALSLRPRNLISLTLRPDPLRPKSMRDMAMDLGQIFQDKMNGNLFSHAVVNESITDTGDQILVAYSYLISEPNSFVATLIRTNADHNTFVNLITYHESVAQRFASSMENQLA